MTTRRVFAVGCSPTLEAQIGAALSTEVAHGIPEDPAAGDVVFLPATRGEEIPLGNAFSACRMLKRGEPHVTVFMLIADGDEVSDGIARFCAADGSVRVDAAGNISEPDELARLVDPTRRDVPVDSLLERLDASIDDESRRDTLLQRVLEEHREDRFLDQLNDAETGLFDGPFAAFKLDEEFKRATRFHQPLSMILLDCGGDLPADPYDRRIVLAEVASVFLTECRDIDTLARFTETVFLFLLPGTGSDGAATVARRMLEGLRERQYSAPVAFKPVAGIATVPTTGVADRAGFLARAETCLEVARDDSSRAGLCAL